MTMTFMLLFKYHRILSLSDIDLVVVIILGIFIDHTKICNEISDGSGHGYFSLSEIL